MRLFFVRAVLPVFVASAAWAQAAQPGWITEALTDCRVWNPLPKPNESIMWSGACQNGVVQGRGVLQWFQDGKPSSRNEGEWRDGKLNGIGVITYVNGNRYEGGFVDGMFGGHGVFTFANGKRVKGEWRDGKLTSQDTHTYANGDRYEGGLVGGKPNGRGVYTYANGDRYEGGFVDEKFSGHGVYTYANGKRIDGEWRDGKLNGVGAVTYVNGNHYEGGFVDDKRNGRGVVTFADGERYEGEYRNDKWNGRGKHAFTNGDRYEGEFVDDKRNGRGVYTYANGDRYEGEFVEGKQNGRGKYTFANGKRIDGEWHDGKLIGKLVGITQKDSPEIQLRAEGGTFRVPVRINDALTLDFTVDSGAADVSIPADVVIRLMRLGTIKSSDFLGTRIYRLADGSVAPSDTFRIRALKVGGREVQNVTGSIAGSLLLGQSFLTRFKSWSIDNNRHVLVLE